MANEGEVSKGGFGFDFGERKGLREFAAEAEGDDGEFGIVGVGLGVRGGVGPADDGGFALGVVDQNAIALANGADGLEGGGIFDAGPEGFAFSFQVREGVFTGVRFCQEIRDFGHETPSIAKGSEK